MEKESTINKLRELVEERDNRINAMVLQVENM